jgi:hypothetical protein
MLATGGQIAIPPETQRVHTAVRKFVSLQHLGWADLSRVIIALFESHRLFHMWEINLYPAYQAVVDLPKSERCLARVIDQVFKCYAAQQFPDASSWGDQSPIHTFFLPWIVPVFPQARYLHLVRDGRDAIASLIERGKFIEGGISLEEATYRWMTSIDRSRVVQKRLGPSQFLEVRYEDLVSEPTKTLEQICAFVDLEYKACMLHYWESPTTIEHRYEERRVCSIIGSRQPLLSTDMRSIIATLASRFSLIQLENGSSVCRKMSKNTFLPRHLVCCVTWDI